MSGPPASYVGHRVLVLGASGFIGRWVVRRLAEEGADVHRGGRAVADLSRPGSAAALVRSLAPAIVFNMAGYGVAPSERDAGLARRLNHELVEELADVCASLVGQEWRGQHLVHAGSALEYGIAHGDLVESTRPAPTTLYGMTKLAGTLALADSTRRGKLRAVTARLFTVYGPGERPGRLLPSLVQATRDGQPVALTRGTQRRDFTYVEDVAEGVLRLGRLPHDKLEVVNLATGTLETVRGFAERAAGVLGLEAARLHFGELPDRPEEMVHDPVNISRLQAWCHWRPATAIEEGVRRTWLSQ